MPHSAYQGKVLLQGPWSFDWIWAVSISYPGLQSSGLIAIREIEPRLLQKAAFRVLQLIEVEGAQYLECIASERLEEVSYLVLYSHDGHCRRSSFSVVFVPQIRPT
jgi:hypothetical protein